MFSKETLPYILSEYKKKFTKVDFRIETGKSEEIYKLLCNKKIDIAFIRGDYHWSQIEKVLFTSELKVISIKNFKLNELPNLNMITYISDEKLSNVINDWWKENFIKRPINTIYVDNVESCVEMVKQGLGYSIIPTSVIKTKLYNELLLKNKNGEKLIRKTKLLSYNTWGNTILGENFIDFIQNLEKIPN